MIREYQCQAANYLIFDSGVAEKFETLTRGEAGPKPTYRRAIFLLGMLLSAWAHGRTHVRSIYRTLTQEVPMKWQYTWGIRIPASEFDGKIVPEQIISESDLQNISKQIYKKLGFTTQWVPDPDDAPGKFAGVRKQRRADLYGLVDSMLEATLVKRPEGSEDYAIDASGIWAEQRSLKKLPAVSTLDPDRLEEGETGESEVAKVKTKKRARRAGRNDASFGVKTAKDGGTQTYYGYALHAITRVPAESKDGVRSEPPLTERIRLGGAADDIVAESLEIIDSVKSTGRNIRRLMADRHYSYKQYDRWLQPLLDRGIEQVVDLREDQQGFEVWDDMKFAAAWAHCPGTPDHLGIIKKPKPNETDKSVWDAYYTKIEERWQYAAIRRKPLDVNGESRWSCPFMKVGCPLVPGSMEAAEKFGLPIVANPPTTNPLPLICTQDSVGLKVRTPLQKRIMQVAQKEYWGLRKQVALFGRRTFVEGFFGTLKGDNAANKRRGSHLYFSIQHAVLDITAFAVVANIRALRTWAQETSYVAAEREDSFLYPDVDPQTEGVMPITPEEYQHLQERRKTSAA